MLEGERVGTMLAVDVLADVTRLAGQAQTILTPSGDWQLFQRGRAMYDSVYDWHTLEGPFVRRHDVCPLLYSGGNWQEATYGVAHAVLRRRRPVARAVACVPPCRNHPR